jgi:hypothetical protein
MAHRAGQIGDHHLAQSLGAAHPRAIRDSPHRAVAEVVQVRAVGREREALIGEVVATE